jgi:hypothetical protein
MIDPAKNDPASSGLRLDRSLKIIDCFLNRVLLGFVTSPSSADAATEGIASTIAATIKIFVILWFSHAAGSEKIRVISEVLPCHPQKRVVMFVNHCGEMSTSPASNDLSRPVTTNSPIAIKNSPSVCLSALLVADMPPRQRNRSS